LDGLSGLPLARARRYRELASDARLKAATAQGAAGEQFLSVAVSWDRMANILERTTGEVLKTEEAVASLTRGRGHVPAALKTPPTESDNT